MGSRFTHAAESRYAPIEGEALAVVDALDKTRFFVLGCEKLIIAVDHKPLLKVFGDRSFQDISNTRLRNLKEKTLRYRFKMVHVPGAKHKAADSLSRHPTGSTNPDILHLQDDIAQASDFQTSFDASFLVNIRRNEPEPTELDTEITTDAIAMLDSLQPRVITWHKVKLATNSDEAMQEILQKIESGFPADQNKLSPSVREFYKFRDNLSAVDGVILYKNRIVVPPALRADILSALHSAHQGVTSMNARAESAVFWPGITSAITALRQNCDNCNRNAPSQPNIPPTPPVPPVYPFQCICADYFKYQGCNYLVIVDRYSNWPIIERAHDGAKGLITSFTSSFRYLRHS